MEVMNTMGIRFYRGSIVNVLRRYFPDIPRTRKGAYKYLVKKGYYDHPAFEDKK
jgi:spore coat polysaccharide biosynthesis protein SpsF (cytidylyltransferase family)